MKLLFSLFIIVSLLSACKKDDTFSAFEKSQTAWKSFKKTSNNSYTYTVTFSSWVGISTSTVISVTNGIVSGREYKRYSIDGSNGQKRVEESWSENASTLNSHKSGAAAITLDAVYEQAATWLKADSKKNSIHFEANNQGMISICGYTPNNCADDCFTGITIADISK